MNAGEGWGNQTGKRAAEFLPWFYFIKSFSLLSSMPMGRWRGQSLAHRQVGDGHKDPSAVGTVLLHFPEMFTRQEPMMGSLSFVCQSRVPLCVADKDPAALSSTALPCLTLIWTQNVLFQTSAAEGRAHTQLCPHWEVSCQRGELALLQLSLTGSTFFFFKEEKSEYISKLAQFPLPGCNRREK